MISTYGQVGGAVDQPTMREDAQVDLRQYLSILKIRRWTVIISAIVGLILAVTMSSRQIPLYSSTGHLIIKPSEFTGFSSAENESTFIKSTQVADLVVTDLGLQAEPQSILGPLSAEPVSPTSNEIVVTYTSPDPALARDAVNSFMASYIAYRTNQAAESTGSERRRLQQEEANTLSRVSQLSRRIERARQAGDEALVSSLQTQATSESANLALIRQQMALLPPPPAESEIAEITKFAALPTAPSSPNHGQSAVLGLIAGLAAGIALAFVRERLDDRFRGRPDLEKALGAPVLATVPRFQARRRRDRGLRGPLDPTGAASEAYRTLRTALQFICAQMSIKSILVTSPSAHEGKTSTAANLGIAISQAGLRVALVSADLRRPQLEKHFEVDVHAGLTTWLLGEEQDLGRLLLVHPDIPNLSLLPAGPIPSNPAELLTSPRFGELISTLEEMADIVLVDSPPVLPVADAAIIASLVGATVLIVDAANTRRSAAVHAKEQIERVGGLLVGAVLNGFDPSTTPYYYEPYYYSRYYEPDKQEGGSGNSQATETRLEEAAPQPTTRRG